MRKEIFVFGSNLAGIHGAGAAKYAYKNYGAEWGVGEGRTGDAYALPTKDENIKTRSLEDIDKSIEKFLDYACTVEEDLLFLLTPIGTGLAGYSKKDIWGILKKYYIPTNVVLTSSWI